MFNTKPNGKLYFYDEGKKFIDEKHFLNGDKETEVTEPQTTQTEDKSKNSELYQRYQQYIKNHPYMSYTEFLKEEESNERAYFQGKTWY